MNAAATPADYIAMFRRRRRFFLIPFVLLFGASIALATMLPSVYESTATIRIDKQHLPKDLIETTVVTGYIDEYLEVLSQKVLSNNNLWEIAESHDLYPDLRDESRKHVVGAHMRRNIRRETLYVKVGPEQRRYEDSVAVAFTVTYAARDPETAHQVANALADLYLIQSHRVRTEQASQLAKFLQEESKRLSEHLNELEQSLARFKEEHVAKLPDFMSLNMNMMESTQDQLDRLNETIAGLRQEKIQLQGQLAQIQPEQGILNADRRGLTPAQQVERLRLDYMDMATKYTPSHPDLRRLRNELAAFDGQAPRAGRILRLVTAIEETRARLIDARETHAADHPEVRELEQAVAEQKSELSSLGSGSLGAAANAQNPAYIAARSRLESVEAKLEAEREKRALLTRRLDEFESRVMGSPAVEEKYRRLMRDYESVLREYRETRDKQLKAEVAEKVERNQIGDRFSLYSPASRPDEPAQPKRAGIALLGLIFASGAGTSLAALAEYFDRTVRGVRGVLNIFGAPPIATVPSILTRNEKRRRMGRLVLLWIVTLGVIAVGIVLAVNIVMSEPSSGVGIFNQG